MGNVMALAEKKPELGENVFVAPNAAVVGDVTIGDNSSVWFSSVIRGDINKVVIGNNTNIQDNCTIHTMWDTPTIIGNNVTIGHNVVLHCSKISDNCLIGTGTVIMGYTEIGENCIIGANSFIPQNKKIPANSMVYGNPAKLIRPLTEEEMNALRESADAHRDLARMYSEKLQDI
ncbi:gamma carbonic anhydrase family protein [uncultured Anaerovibrio sp.]|jgi:carbonic anhydrase/acetyltransferase-like protein (isoleucine patch superfamily)|uniref:gamma carbonic anhydrase family protein n=1 Tax=uncultured Anaerovibrio sp. TaxID=361586 RepID=UPI002602D0FB|nr:gamma carbonic anhydrase family protein [uncultured Anaerovibrio sp.]